VKSLRPQETASYETLMVENLDRLSRKIADLERQSPSALNEGPQS
jgi:DNA invertase Pin-like site-specific DNA recombinase